MSTTDDHGWHVFDAERGLEVRRVDDAYELRRTDAPDFVVPLSAAQWDAYRTGVLANVETVLG